MSQLFTLTFPSKFKEYLTANGFVDELDFWKSLSGLSSGTCHDHMVEYLTTLGYTGTAADKFRAFLRDQSQFEGTTFDMLNDFLTD